MPDIRFSRLTHLGLIRIQGPDALTFLQGQCTQDVMSLTPETARHGAFCTAKGRAVTNCWLYALSKEDVYLICHAASAPLLAKHLQKYIVFFRTTTLSYQPDAYAALGLLGETIDLSVDSDENAFAVAWGQDRRILWYRPDSDAGKAVDNWAKSKQETPLYTWQAEDIRQQRLWLDAEQAEQWIPQNFSLDELDGISFNKGCYTGQEVIARLHYKGQSKKRLFTLHWAADVTNATQIYQNGNAVGNILNQVRSDNEHLALAIIKTDAVQAPLWLDEKEQLSAQLLH